QAIAEVAEEFASRRSNGIPRFGRQSLKDRAQAFEALFHIGLGPEFPPAQIDDGTAAAVERVMGIDQGRRYRPDGVEPWLTGPPSEGIMGLQQLGSLPRLIEALESATDPELEQAGIFARTVLTGISAFSQIADAFAGYRNASGFAAIEGLK